MGSSCMDRQPWTTRSQHALFTPSQQNTASFRLPPQGRHHSSDLGDYVDHDINLESSLASDHHQVWGNGPERGGVVASSLNARRQALIHHDSHVRRYQSIFATGPADREDSSCGNLGVLLNTSIHAPG